MPNVPEHPPPPAPVSRLKLATFNTSSGLASQAPEIDAYMDHNDIHILFCPDSGTVDSRAHKGLHNKKIFHCPAGPDSWKCAIIVRSGIPTLPNPKYDKSGRAIAIDIPVNDNSPSVIRCIALYQPPGLDNAPDSPATAPTDEPRGTLKGRALRGEAERLRTVAHDWAREQDVIQAFLGGDLNETHCGPLDRAVGPHRTPGGFHLGTIHSMLEDDGWHDLYTHSHPDRAELLTPDFPGHTFKHAKGGSSRIDYILSTPPPDPTDAIECIVDHSYMIGADTGHLPLLCSVPTPTINDPEQDCFYHSGGIRAHLLNDDQIASIAFSVNQAVTANSQHWLALLLRAQASGKDTATPLIGLVARELASTISSATDKIVPPVRAGLRSLNKVRPLVRRLLSIKRNLFHLRTAVQNTLFAIDHRRPVYTAYSHDAHRALVALDRLGVHNLDVEYEPPPPWRDIGDWRAWLANSSLTLKAIRKRIKAIRKQDTGHSSNAFNTQMKSSRGRGKFYSELKGQLAGSHGVNSARDEHGHLHRHPDAYMPIVLNQVSQPFLTHKSSPAVPNWRTLSAEEKETGTPFWWELMYSFNAKGLDVGVWDGLSAIAPVSETFEALSRASSGKAPGHDHISIDVLKICTGAREGGKLDPNNPTLLILTALANTCLVNRVCPPTLKEGIIVMIPKPGKPPGEIANMRPITLLPELGKLLSRILANRITTILHHHPYILNDAQRAYLVDGSTRQCIAALFDVCEDHWSRKRADNDLVIVSYDVRKAFDTVQRFSILAACDRLGIPRAFTEYVIATLADAQSKVKCKHGLTDTFTLQSSVRQGDPLAAIVYIIMMDSLHDGLACNPLGTHPHSAYRMELGPTLASLGYADDTILASLSMTGARLQHDWVREFFVAHHLKFNSDKSYCTVASGRIAVGDVEWHPPLSIQSLPGIRPCDIHDPSHGLPNLSHPSLPTGAASADDIVCSLASTPFRYLGIMFRVDLQQDQVKTSTQFIIWNTCREIRLRKLNLCQASDTLRELLFPRIELKLAFTDFPTKTLDRWMTIIRRSVLHSGYDTATRQINTAALALILGIRPPKEEATIAQIVQCASALRGPPLSPATATSRCRLTQALRTRKLPLTDLRTGSYSHHLTGVPVRCKKSRLLRTLKAAFRLGIRVSWPRRNSHRHQWTPRDGEWNHALQSTLLADRGTTDLCAPLGFPRHFLAYTDGSFIPVRGGSYASILQLETNAHVALCDRPKAILHGPTPLAGANYSAELGALLATLQALPLDSSVTIVTDATSAIPVLLKKVTPAGAELRTGCRAQIRACRHIITLKSSLGGNVSFRPVRSHTGAPDPDSEGNRLADRTAPLSMSRETPPFLLGEDFAFWKPADGKPCLGHPRGLRHIAGDLRKTALQLTNKQLLQRWAKHPLQGATPREAGGRMLDWVTRIRRTKDPNLLLFLLQMVTKQLPVPTRTLWGTQRSDTAILCALCHEPCDHEHPFVCRANDAARAAFRLLTKTALHLTITKLEESGATTQAHISDCREFAEHSNYTDLLAPPGAWGFPGEHHPDPLAASALHDAELHDRWTTLCGIPPAGLIELLTPASHFMECDDVTAKRARAVMAGQIVNFRLSLLRNSKAVFVAWKRATRAEHRRHQRRATRNRIASDKPVVARVARRASLPPLPHPLAPHPSGPARIGSRAAKRRRTEPS